MYIKSIASIIFLLCIISNLSFAQNKGEFKVAYGYSGLDAFVPGSLETANATACVAANIILIPISILLDPTEAQIIPCEKFEARPSRGTISINYSQIVNEKLSLGGQFNFSQYQYRRGNDPWKKVSLNAIYFKLDFLYFSDEKLKLYGNGMLGMVVNSKVGEKNFPGLHFTPIGIRVGNKHAFNCEFGIGTGNIISAGYSVILQDG